MVNDLRKAAEQALEALEQLQGGCTDSGDGTVEAITVWCPEIITALREALAKPDVPEVNTQEASALIDSVLAEYNWPSNPKNAALAGYEAACRAAAPQPKGTP